MARKGAVALFAVLVWVLPQIALAAPPPVPPPEHASGKASPAPGFGVTLSANGDLTSGSAAGFVTNRWPGGLAYEVRVTCMLVVDNRASIGGEITASAVFPGHVGSGLVVTVADNSAAGAPDQLGHSLNVVPQPLPGADCPFPPFMSDDFNVQGNLQVTGSSGSPAPAAAISSPSPVVLAAA